MRIVQRGMSLNGEFDSNAGRAQNRELIPMRDEPETERCMLRMNAHPYEQSGAADVSRDDRVCREQSGSRLAGNRAAGSIRIDREIAEASAIQPAAQIPARCSACVPAAGHGTEPGATDAPDPAMDGDAPDRTQTGTPA